MKYKVTHRERNMNLANKESSKLLIIKIVEQANKSIASLNSIHMKMT